MQCVRDMEDVVIIVEKFCYTLSIKKSLLKSVTTKNYSEK